MAKKITYEIGGIAGIAFTKTEARDTAERIAARCIERLDMGSLVLTGPRPEVTGVVAVSVEPNLHGWQYGWLETGAVKSRCIGSGYGTRELALYAAVEHTVMLGVHADTTPEDEELLERWVAAALGDPGQAITMRSEWGRRIAWYRANREALAGGATKDEAHAIACRSVP